jgi:hypothetical protein
MSSKSCVLHAKISQTGEVLTATQTRPFDQRLWCFAEGGDQTFDPVIHEMDINLAVGLALD